MADRQFLGKMNNRGSALLTVILVVGFLTILATTLLYITGMEFQTKQADYQNKRNFYTGETALEEIRAKLMDDASEAALLAYDEVSKNYIALGSKENRKLEYNTVFVAKIQENLIPADAGPDYWKTILAARLNPGVGDPPPYKLDFDDSIYAVVPNAAEGYIRIKGIKMTYIDPDTKLATILSTDLDICAPEIDWSAEGALQMLEEDVTWEMAAESRTTVDASKCVKYANWKKE